MEMIYEYTNSGVLTPLDPIEYTVYNPGDIEHQYTRVLEHLIDRLHVICAAISSYSGSMLILLASSMKSNYFERTLCMQLEILVYSTQAGLATCPGGMCNRHCSLS